MDGGIVEQNSKIKFDIETDRVLEVLSTEIYDSPLALLRENIQNAYDAILMESKRTGKDLQKFVIKLSINDNILEISDDGIGMSLETLKNNFWKPGSSGKKTELAKQAGVVGTFGIGALANFGVCEKLEVFTKAEGQKQIHSWAEKKNLKIGADCIECETLDSNVLNGTIIKAQLKSNISINANNIENYLTKYIRLLPVNITINGKEFKTIPIGIKNYLNDPKNLKLVNSFNISDELVTGEVDFYILDKSKIAIEIKNISIGNQSIQGILYLIQDKAGNMAYRNFFGLTSIPFSSQYNLGGIINLDCLIPTAGREAISNESIKLAQSIINIVEKELTNKISVLDVADKMPYFINYISSKNLMNLAGNILIDYEPNTQKVKLSEIEKIINKTENAYYYKGTDSSIKETFSREGNILFLLSNNHSRRRIQEGYLKTLGVNEKPDEVQPIEILKDNDLNLSEFSLQFKLQKILEEDYLISNIKIKFCKLTHGIHTLLKKESDNLVIYIHRDSNILEPLYKIYDEEYGLFNSFIKDFIRTNLYNQIQQYIPSSHRQGTDALKNILSKNREIYKYNKEEIGNLEGYFKDCQKGDMSFEEVLNKANLIKNTQLQQIAPNNVGTILQEIPKIEKSPKPSNPDILSGVQQAKQNALYEASPSILYLDTVTDKKILQSETLPQLNNFSLFLGLSDRLVKMDKDFFMKPHATKVIWASRRVIYLFSHISKTIGLYYNIELEQPITFEMGSLSLLTTTIVTKDRIFVPVPKELSQSFEIKSGEKRFYVTYDILG